MHAPVFTPNEDFVAGYRFEPKLADHVCDWSVTSTGRDFHGRPVYSLHCKQDCGRTRRVSKQELVQYAQQNLIGGWGAAGR